MRDDGSPRNGKAVTDRVWTKEELERVWPLPDGWTWTRDMGWMAIWKGGGLVGVDASGHLLASFTSGIPLAVSLAVVSVALGLDSREDIAAAIVKSGDIEERIGKAAGGTSIITGMARAAEAYRCAEMVRRGRVSP